MVSGLMKQWALRNRIYQEIESSEFLLGCCPKQLSRSIYTHCLSAEERRNRRFSAEDLTLLAFSRGWARFPHCRQVLIMVVNRLLDRRKAPNAVDDIALSMIRGSDVA